jgi:hypothetical protein
VVVIDCRLSMVDISVGVALEVGELQARTVWCSPYFLGFGVLPPPTV